MTDCGRDWPDHCGECDVCRHEAACEAEAYAALRDAQMPWPRWMRRVEWWAAGVALVCGAITLKTILVGPPA